MRETECLGRRERKKQEVLLRIRNAAAELFQEKGFEATTVEEIAERADVAKGTFFNYFPRKDALLEWLGDMMVDQVQEELGALSEWEGTALQQFERLYYALGDRAEQNPELSKMILIESMRRFWLRMEGDPREQWFHALTRSVLERARERGEVEREFDLDIAAKLLEATYFTTLVDWLRSGTPRGVFRREVKAKLEIVFRGLGASDLMREGGAR
jgi:TetR/AcrR family transcriptional regulator, cholesterol catabolism regulator